MAGRQFKGSLESNAACLQEKRLHQEVQDSKSRKEILEMQHLEHLREKRFEHKTLREPKNANTWQIDDRQLVQTLNSLARSRKECTKRSFWTKSTMHLKVQ